jgi:hypothetical protein
MSGDLIGIEALEVAWNRFLGRESVELILVEMGLDPEVFEAYCKQRMKQIVDRSDQAEKTLLLASIEDNYAFCHKMRSDPKFAALCVKLLELRRSVTLAGPVPGKQINDGIDWAGVKEQVSKKQRAQLRRIDGPKDRQAN